MSKGVGLYENRNGTKRKQTIFNLWRFNAMTIEEMWDRLTEIGVSEQTLTIISKIDGYSKETMLNVLDCVTGCKNFDQLEEL